MPLLKKPQLSKMCPPGYHVVRGHQRTCASGTRTWVDSHIRRNPTHKDPTLLEENLAYLYWHSRKKYPKLKPIKGFSNFHELDSIIQFWLDYWRSQGLKFPKFDPLLIKAIIAVESSFNPKAQSKISGAMGLMQLTNQTRRILSGTPNQNGHIEISKHTLTLAQQDLEDPISNIAAGIRWLIYKFEKIPKRAEQSVFNAIKNYYSWNLSGEQYAKKVFKLYENSK